MVAWSVGFFLWRGGGVSSRGSVRRSGFAGNTAMTASLLSCSGSDSVSDITHTPRGPGAPMVIYFTNLADEMKKNVRGAIIRTRLAQVRNSTYGASVERWST